MLTFGPLDAGVLVVAQEESLPAAALVAAHHVDADLLASPVALRTLVHIWQENTRVTHGKRQSPEHQHGESSSQVQFGSYTKPWGRLFHTG